jgi:hypothetical protein
MAAALAGAAFTAMIQLSSLRWPFAVKAGPATDESQA